MILRLWVAECDGCRSRVDGDTVPPKWSQLHDPDGTTKLFCCRVCMVASHAGLIQVSRGVALGMDVKDIEILELMVDGLSNSQISFRTGWAESTVKNRLTVIYGKLGVSSRQAAMLVTLRLGIVSGPDLNALQSV